METLSPALIKGLFVFLATALGDILWTFYIRRTGEGKALQAALFSAAIMVTGGIVVIFYVSNSWYLAPAALGAFVGTLFTVRYDLARAAKKAKSQ